VTPSEVPRSAGPLLEAGAFRRALPFALIALIGTGSLAVSDLLNPDELLHPMALLLALGLTAGIIAAAVVMPWQRLPTAAQNVPPLLFFVVVVLLRDAGGGAAAGIGSLALLPVCWLAMYAGQSALRLSLVAASGVFFAPWLLIGGESYPAADLRRGLILLLVAGLVGTSVQTLVRGLQDQRSVAAEAARRAAALAEQLVAVARVRHSMQVNRDPRGVICEGARDLAGAAVSFLLEPLDAHNLERTAGVGFELTAVTVPMDPARSAAADCLLSGRRLFIADARLDPRIPSVLRDEVGADSLLYEPVIRRGKIVAVLVVGWREITVPDEAALAAVALMAVETAVVLEQADLLEQLQKLARTDQLTGVPNRRAFDELLPDVLQSTTPTAPLCVALLDLDHFKIYNDTFGHPAGDRLLQTATRIWARQLRGTDVLARFGGEEFVVVLPNCDLHDAVSVLDKLRNKTPADQTVSVGIARWDGIESQQALIQRVDAALYRAKTDGRNRLHCAA
jgi:diguanylate cyclase (GGDEF)-like protein